MRMLERVFGDWMSFLALTRIREETLKCGNLFSGSWIPPPYCWLHHDAFTSIINNTCIMLQYQFSVRYGRSSNSIRQASILLRLRRRCSWMVQVLFDWSVPVHSLQWCPVWIGPRPLRGTSGISPRTCVVYSVLCRCHRYSHQTRLLCSFLRRRSSDLWSFFADSLLKFGAKDVCLHRRNQHMDGQQPSKTQSIKNWGNMVGFITTAEALPNGRSEYRRCFDQALQLCSRSRGVRRRWSVAGGSHLSTLPHVLLSPSSATCRAPESHHELSSLAHQSTCSQSSRLLQRSAGWPTTDSDQQASIHSPCSSSPCAAATRLGQCLESDACAAPLAFHSTEDSVQAVLGGVQVFSQHGADILTRSLRAYLVFWGSFSPPIDHSWRPSHSIDKDCDNRQAWIFCCRSCGLEQFIHYSERL